MSEDLSWLDGLPKTGDPDRPDLGKCPWDHFAESAHDSWAYRHEDVLVVRSYEGARTVLSDRRFKQGMSTRIARKAPDLDPRFVARRRNALLAREGPDHIRMRRIASKAAFTPRAANRHRPLMQATMHEIADQVPDDGVTDAAALIYHYPIRVIAQVLGTRSDEVASFASVVNTIFRAQRGLPDAVPQAWPAFVELEQRLIGLIERKRKEPGEDLISDLIRSETEDGVLNQEELLDIAIAVVMAGTDTTRNMLTRALCLLTEHPDVWARLTDDEALEAVVEEILRFAPLAPVRRVPAEDVEVNGVTVPEGSVVIVDFGGANRDPSVVSDPDTFTIDRDNPLQNLSLSHGHKFCLGASLAKAEIAEGLRVLRERFPTIDAVEPAVWTTSGVSNIGELMVRLGRTGPT